MGMTACKIRKISVISLAWINTAGFDINNPLRRPPDCTPQGRKVGGSQSKLTPGEEAAKGAG